MVTRNTGRGRAAGGVPPRGELPQSDPRDKPFDPEVLDRTVIAIPLLRKLREEDERAQQEPGRERQVFPVIIDLHLEYPGGRAAAKLRVLQMLHEIQDMPHSAEPGDYGVLERPTRSSEQYIFAELDGAVIRALVRRDSGKPMNDPRRKSRRAAQRQAIYRIWPDFEVQALIDKSVSTIKADAALNSFATTGAKIVWAVMDSGIDVLHPHFARYDNLNLTGVSLSHRDFTLPTEGASDRSDPSALVDAFGHGTHVAGIIGGVMDETEGEIVANTRYRDEAGQSKEQPYYPARLSGVAPRCKLLSLKVLDEKGTGRASSLIAAIAEIQRINGNGRHIRVHGVNMSVGYDFEPEWFACGQSPLCVEVNRLVKSGVVVVVAAGNTGYGFAQTKMRGMVAAGLGLTINDPGNAEFALTVGSTHRDMPHVYGVSYFSSKGPTGDGRAKPDLLAPGEKIVSCASGSPAMTAAAQKKALERRMSAWTQAPPAPAKKAAARPATARKVVARYKEDSGTSMAAPHVSGAIAAFLSVRREFIGQPERVKEVFLSTATDLKRDRYFQGHGLIDLMRAIQSV